MSAVAYRPEIDGLRAVAVVPVVLYHAGVSAFSGGFSGVDVFFVISGYLITAIILRELGEGRFSPVHFWKRRAKRILPALFVVLACTLPFAWAWLLPEDLHRYAGSLAAAVLFCANFWFWRTMGYFAPDAELQPLVHTWSLGVEEQFYLLFPLFMLLAFRGGRRVALALVAAALVASFALSEWASELARNANFYLLPTRAWELLAGSLCAFAGPRAPRGWHGAAAGAGLALVVAGFFYLDPSRPFPSHLALLPVVGTVLVILFADAGKGAGRLLALQPFMWIGLISYSLYLWHQPLFAFARLRTAWPPGDWQLAGLALLSFVLAWLSWRFVEQPFRRRDYSPRRLRLALGGGGALLAAMGAVAAYGLGTDGVRWRLHENRDPEVRAFLAQATATPDLPQDCRTTVGGARATACWLAGGPQSERRIAVYGDSHARMFRQVMGEIAERRGLGLFYATSGGCPPLLDVDVLSREEDRANCRALAEFQLEQAREQGFDLVFLMGRWTLYTHGPGATGDTVYISRGPSLRGPTYASSREAMRHGLAWTVEAYRALGAQVLLVNQAPQQEFDARRTLGWLRYSRTDGDELASALGEVSVLRRADDARHAASLQMLRAEEREGVAVLDFNHLFAEGDRYAWATPEGPYYYDNDHLSLRGTQHVAPLFEQALADRGL